MNSLYLLTQRENNNYDTYDSCVVVALTKEDAQQISPSWGGWEETYYSSWADKPEQVEVKYLGKASSNLEAGDIVCASFNAG